MLLDCPECGGALSSEAESCPNCGYVLNPRPTSLDQIFGILGCFLKAILLLVAAVFLLSLCSGESGIKRIQALRAPSPLPQFKTARGSLDASSGESVVGAAATRRGQTRGITGTARRLKTAP